MENTANQFVTTEQAQKTELQNPTALFAPVMHAVELFSAIDFAKEACKDEEHKSIIGEEATYLFRGPLKLNGEEILNTWAIIADIEPHGEGTALATLAFDLEGGMTSKFMTTKILIHYLQAKPGPACEGNAIFVWTEESNEVVADFLRRNASR